jgi:hypothetical protein
MPIASRFYSNGDLWVQNTGFLDEVSLTSLDAVNNRIYADGLFQNYGEFDEVSLSSYIGAVTYNFTSNIATANILGYTVVGNPGSGVNGGTGAVTGSVTAGYPGTILSGSVTGGNAGVGQFNKGGGGGGGIGGGAGGNGGGAGGNAINIGTSPEDLFSVVNLAIGAGTSTLFGDGGRGGDTFMVAAASGQFAGGGGGGGGGTGSSYEAPGAGANAGIVIKYIVAGVTYAVAINQSGVVTGGGGRALSSAGVFTFPPNTTYMKIWCIGKGVTGDPGGGNNGNGGGAGGVGWLTIDNTTSENLVKKRVSSGSYQIYGIFDEVTGI